MITTLKTVNVSGLENLKTVGLPGTSLKTLLVTGCSSLVVLDCSESTEIEELILDGCSSLGIVLAYGCPKLASIDASEASNLDTLVSYNNALLSDIDVRGCPLTSLVSHTCPQLTTVDISQCSAVFDNIELYNCGIVTLDLSGTIIDVSGEVLLNGNVDLGGIQATGMSFGATGSLNLQDCDFTTDSAYAFVDQLLESDTTSILLDGNPMVVDGRIIDGALYTDSQLYDLAEGKGYVISPAPSGVEAGQYALISTGTQYVNTGINLKQAYDVRTTVARSNLLDGLSYYTGSTVIGNGAQGVSLESSGFGVAYGPVASGLVPAETLYPNVFYTCEKAGGWFLALNSSIDFSAYVISDFSIPSFLFGVNNNGSPSLFTGKIQTHEIWSSSSRDVYLRNMWAVPEGMTALGASTPAPSNCMYDSVSNTYFENIGSGVFGVEEVTQEELPDTSPVEAGDYALRSSGAQYIDTGLHPSGDFCYELVAKFPTTLGGYLNFIGSRDSAGDRGFLAYYYSNTDSGVGWGSTTNSSSIATDRAYHTYSRLNKLLSVDGGTGVLSNDSGGALPLYLFGLNSYGGTLRAHASISTFTAWGGSTLVTKVADMWAVPEGMTALGASTPAPSNCMYDSVSNTYFENIGAGNLSVEVL